MPTPPKGLATLALLKTRLDEGKDHLGLFEPFVEDTVVFAAPEHFAAADLRAAVDERHGLLIPIETVTTLLGRLVRRAAVRREGGRYFRLVAQPTIDIANEKVSAERDLQSLGGELKTFAFSTKTPFTSEDDALASLIGFLQENNVALLLEEPPDGLVPGLPKQVQRVVARFVTQECLARPELRTTLERLVVGLVLKNALLLQDLSLAAQRFVDLQVFLDSQILFSLLGLTGNADAIATTEVVSLLKDTGAIPSAFDVTLAEMQRVLAMLEDHLGTSEGRLSLRQTPLVRHVLTSGMRPTDVRILSASLERRLRDAGVQIRETPRRNRDFTLDEAKLAEVLVDRSGDVQQPRIKHDVDCVAAVLTLRSGKRPRRLEMAHAVFASASPAVIRNVSAWHRGQGESGLSPILDIRALANVAWLKRPASARSLKVHELVALCAAALRPSRETWEKFVRNLKDLRADGSLADAETVAIVASELAEPILAEWEDDREPDAASIHEAIDRVKDAYRDEGRRTVMQMMQEARTQATEAQQRAAVTRARQVATDEHLRARAVAIGRGVGTTAAVLIMVVGVAAILVALPGVIEAASGWMRWVARGLLGASAILTSWGLWSGFNVLALRTTISEAAAAKVVVYLVPPDPGDGPPESSTAV